jgi:hypothetical protein
MRHTLTALLIVLLLAPELPARSNRDWKNVKELKAATSVEILLWSGENVSGEIDGVNDAGLRLLARDRRNPQASSIRTVDRASIQRILRFRQPYLPDSRRWMVTGAVAGGAVGVTVGAISDIRHGGNYHWFEGALGGAGMGFLVSCAALAAVGVFDVARMPGRRKVVYQDLGPHPSSPSPPSQ